MQHSSRMTDYMRVLEIYVWSLPVGQPFGLADALAYLLDNLETGQRERIFIKGHVCTIFHSWHVVGFNAPFRRLDWQQFERVEDFDGRFGST